MGEEDEVSVEIKRLLSIAERDTGGSKRVAQFLLSLWNGNRYRADLQDLMYIDQDLFDSMVKVWAYLYRRNLQLDSVVTEHEIQVVIRRWGDSLWVKN